MVKATLDTAEEKLLLDAALENIPYGFCVWSTGFRLLLWNRHYCDLYNLDPARLTRGMPLEAVVRLSTERGNHPGINPEDFAAMARIVRPDDFARQDQSTG